MCQSRPVVLASMPWELLAYPSIQLGILRALLEKEKIPVRVESLKFPFLAAAKLTPSEYEGIASDQAGVALGDWIFAGEVFDDRTDQDEAYLAYAGARGVSEENLALARRLRASAGGFLDSCVACLLQDDPRVIGFTTTYNQNVPSLALAKRLKARRPDVAILFGGANCEGPMGAALKRAFPFIDIVVRGEAEEVLPPLLRELLAGESPTPRPGLCLQLADGTPSVTEPVAPRVRMDDVPPPNFDEFFEKLENSPARAEVGPQVRLLYESARGCWWGAKHHCTFCGLNGASMTFRSKSGDRVVSEILALASRHQNLNFQVVDNIIDLEHITSVMPRFRALGVDLRIFYETKSNLSKRQLATLAAAGVDQIQPGIESMSDPILTLMRKGVTAFQNVRLLKWCAELRISVFWNMIYGFPGEPPEEYARMAKDLRSLVHLEPPNLTRLAIDRFSPYHTSPEKLGIALSGPSRHYALIYDLSPADIADLAYSFEYRHLDGRDPESYIGPLRERVATWRASDAMGSLTWRRGPGFVVVRDRRAGFEARDHVLDGAHGVAYARAADGATTRQITEALEAAGHAAAARATETVMAELSELAIVWADGHRYLSLALADARNHEEPTDAKESLRERGSLPVLLSR